MGSINTIWHPKHWKFCLEGKSKIIEDDIIYKMIIGIGEDYQYYEIIEFISKENYDNLINGNYYIKSFPEDELPVLIFNNKTPIPLVKGTEIPYDRLSLNQKEYIHDLNNKKKILRK